MSLDKYVKTVENDPNFMHEVSAGPLRIKVRFVPKEYFVAKNLLLRKSGRIDEEQLKMRNKVYVGKDECYYFSVDFVKMENDSVQKDPLYSDTDPYAFADNLETLLFDSKDHVFLIDGQGYKVQAINDHFQRNFGMMPVKRLLLAFPQVAYKGHVKMFIEELGTYSVGATLEWKLRKVQLREPIEVKEALEHTT